MTRARGGRRYPRDAIIDIGSNSVRLVVYDGPRRAPAIMFNEKVAAGLGRSLAETGRIDGASFNRALAALTRFAALTEAMQVDSLRAVATAAVREAKNGEDFIAAAADIGLTVEILPGEAEADAAGYGVISAFPDADGIVADLGGGSLELVRIRGGRTGARASFPLGVLRLAALRSDDQAGFDRLIAKTLAKAGWPDGDDGDDMRGLPLYLVGGSWRALSRLDMMLTRYPLPIMDQHDMAANAVGRLQRATQRMTYDEIKAIPGMSGNRAATLDSAAALLTALSRALRSSRMVVSSSGLREGLLYQGLSAAERAQDPLLVAAEYEGVRLARFPGHGRLIDRWLSPLFGDDDAHAARLRLAACLLSDVAWSANPDFRAERGLEIALHGNWRGIDIPGRVILGKALHAGFGGSAADFPAIPDAVPPAALARAQQWGHAIRLAQRLSGGVAAPLEASRIALRRDKIVLTLVGEARTLAGENVDRRMKALGGAMGLGWQVATAEE